jgi:5-methylcytosine-specific restriction endonuclease McrA
MGQEIYNSIQSAENDLGEIMSAIDLASKQFCSDAVASNGSLAFLLYTTDKERLDATIRDVIISNVQNHENHKTWLDSLARQAWALSVELKKLRDNFAKAWNANLGEIDRAKDRIREHQSRVEALTARLREHAINSPEVRDKVWAITEGRCIYCDVELTRERDPEDPQRCFVVDHVVPKAAGGPDHLTNYVPACASCNGGKAARPWFDFVRKRHAAPDLKIVGGSEA